MMKKPVVIIVVLLVFFIGLLIAVLWSPSPQTISDPLPVVRDDPGPGKPKDVPGKDDIVVGVPVRPPDRSNGGGMRPDRPGKVVRPPDRSNNSTPP